VAVFGRAPDRLIAAKNGASPLISATGRGKASSQRHPSLLAYTQRVVPLEDGQMAVVTRDDIRVSRMDGTPVSVEPTTISWTPVMAEKGGYKHFMQKEIHEQPRAIVDTIGTRVSEEDGEVSSTASGSRRRRWPGSSACTSWPAAPPGMRRSRGSS
jgi:glucosamine--fructose-6-phosphate aminotransferase (isomerizing)